ncbi:peptidoglycan D,D-transpeptidase FtsI family protein [Enterocloster lavalensis]|uniref:peptidoglycan D,D-transpeptidase FtsI family protein n=2 Tax=Enterocloster lavalensis TaxID=460384 RepID=UPI000D1AABC0|nr:penicillin-binding transpeptidase domain-containing protein [Enterocloster lavalensis]PST35266.1 peptidoglycan glycosyltransferase [Enterocloster lavalensis]
MKKADPNPKANRNILKLVYVIVALFLGLIAYMAYFLQARGEDVINNSYNARLDSFADRIIRGKILAADGTVLAETQIDGDGNETRVYPYGSVFDHAVGYSTKGKTGIESLANFYLLTSHVNLMEQALNQMSGEKNLGDNVYTTLDPQLQQAAWDALGDRRGAVIAMEPDTGKILAMVSKPGYDPNTIAADWETLTSEENDQGQLLNRVTQGMYPPGSTFKIVTALEYMRERPEDYKNFQFDCNGLYVNGDYQIRCYHGNAHGHQDFTLAFANSCNGAFASLGLELDLGRFARTAQDVLFNSPLPLSGLPYKQSSFAMKPGAGTWEILQTSMGQGVTQITPLHNALITAAIANGGTLMRPYLLDHVENVGGEEIRKFLPTAHGNLMTAEEAANLTELMRAVVTEGTASAVRTDAYTVAAKTGSAEFETGKETHAWFTGFAPAESPKIVVTVVVEEAGSGGREAAPIARQLFDLYMSR